MTSPEMRKRELSRLVVKLRTIADLSPTAEQALLALPLRLKVFEENADIVSQGDEPSECALVVDGFACRYKVLGEGQRQIMSFHSSGDIPDLQSLHLRVMDHSLLALTPATIAFLPHGPLLALTREHPDIAAAFWRDTLIDAAVFREWLAGVGRRSARQRIAHLICELYTRMRAVGLTDGSSFELPVTQAELGDALGLSSVHVNRVMQELRRDDLIVSRGRHIAIGEWERLQAAGDFDPEYLHLREQRAA